MKINFEFQWLINVPAYIPRVWTFPTMGFEMNHFSMYKTISIVFMVGKKSYGFRIYSLGPKEEE